MVRHPSVIARVLVPLALVACGGGAHKTPKKPVAKPTKAVVAPQITEEDRATKRMTAAHSIIADGSACLPPILKEHGAPRLELAAVGSDAMICAIDTDESRLLGPVACWKVDLANGGLTYQNPAPLPGHGISVTLDDRCARGCCLPKDAKAPASKIAHMAWSADGSKVAVLAGDDLHLYDVASKAHESSFSIRGDKGVTNDPSAVHWVGDVLFVEGMDAGPFSAVWAFKADGSPIGPIEAIGSKDGKPLSTYGGSFSLLDKTRVAVAELGFSTLTIYQVDTGQRSKLVRKLAKPPCKNDEVEAYWRGEEDKLPAKCKDSLTKTFGHLVGASAVAGSKNFLVMLRGARLGELAVLDSKTLAEKKAIKLSWCEADPGKASVEAAEETAAPKSRKAAAKPPSKTEDPDAGGE